MVNFYYIGLKCFARADYKDLSNEAAAKLQAERNARAAQLRAQRAAAKEIASKVGSEASKNAGRKSAKFGGTTYTRNAGENRKDFKNRVGVEVTKEAYKQETGNILEQLKKDKERMQNNIRSDPKNIQLGNQPKLQVGSKPTGSEQPQGQPPKVENPQNLTGDNPEKKEDSLADKAKERLGKVGDHIRNMGTGKKMFYAGAMGFIGSKIARRKRIKELRAAHPDWSEAQIRAAAGGSNALGTSLLVAGGAGLANRAVQKGWFGKDLATDENRRKLELEEAQKKKNEEKAQAEHEAKLREIQGN